MPTITDIDPIANMFGNILTAKPIRQGALTVVLLMLAEPDWLTLTEGGDLVQVTEVDEAGSAPTVKVANMTDRPLLLVDGEELVGAKENRILNTTVLVAARAESTIPVSLRGARALGLPRPAVRVERRLAVRVHSSEEGGVGHALGPGRAGTSVGSGRRLERAGGQGGRAPGGEAHRRHARLYVRFEAELVAARREMTPGAGQLGVIVYVSGRWAGVDLLAGSGLFARAWSSLCAGYAGAAIGTKPSSRLTPSPAVLQRLRACPVEPAQAVGLGSEYRLTGLRTAGAALVADDRVAHLMAFPAVAPE